MKDISTEVSKTLPPQLSAVAGDRDLITTIEFANVFSVASQTVRKNYSLTGHCYGIKPAKIGNRLLWSVARVAERLGGAV
jgi:hypothetical protein